MPRLPLLSLSCATALALGALAGCDAAPSARASAGADQVATFVLRDGMTVDADGETIVLTVDGQEVALRPVEMFALTLVANRAAYDQLTPEQREVYDAGEPVYVEGKGGGECDGRPDLRMSGTEAGTVSPQPFAFIRPVPTGGGGGSPCPPPPVRALTPDLAGLLFGDHFEIGEWPVEAETEPAAGGINLRW